MTNTYNIERIKKIFEDEKYVLISTEYKYNTKIQYVCDKGHDGEILLKNFVYGQRCRKCTNLKKAESKKTNWNDIENEFVKYDYRLVSVENDYKNCTSKLTFVCDEGHENKCSYTCFTKRESKCSLCDKVKRKQNKYDIDSVQTLFEEKGFTLITTEYQNCKQILDYICSKGHKNETTLEKFMQKCECLECNGKKKPNKITIDFIQKLCDDNGFTLLSDEYEGYEKKLKMICPKGHEISVSYHSWSGTNYGCFSCGREKTGEKTRLSYDFVKTEFEKRKFTLLTDNYTNKKQKLEYICDKNHKGEMSFDSFYYQNSGCIECSGSKKHTIDTVRQLLKNEEYILLTKTYTNNKQKIRYKCPNKHINEMRFDMFVNGNRCPNCKINKGIKLSTDYLDKNNLSYILEHKYPECKNINPLPFDIYVNDTFLIEIDGQQHFEPIEHFGGAKNCLQQQKRDIIKNQYCMDKKIPLLRISYKEHKRIPEFIEKFINILKTHEEINPLIIFSNMDLYKPHINIYVKYILNNDKLNIISNNNDNNNNNDIKTKNIIKTVVKNGITINIRQ